MKMVVALGAALLLTACSQQQLPVEALDADEAGPATLQEAWDEAELVVLGRVTGHEPGARIFGGDPVEDPTYPGPYYEDVTLDISVEETFKGQAVDNLKVQWPAYVLDDPSLDSRRALLRLGGMVLDPEARGTYVFFLKDYGGAFGLTGVSSAAGAAEIEEGRVRGEAGRMFDGLQGESLADVIDQAQS